MSRTIHLKDGQLTLLSKPAEELCERLLADGLFWEFISGLFDERARGIAQEDISAIKLSVSNLEHMLSMLIDSGVVAKSTTTPAVNTGDNKLPEPFKHVEKEVIKLDDQKIGSKGVLNRMKNMRRD
jgi:hypothetical protein